MKKFFVGLLSIFMICAGALLSACGANSPELKVYDSLGQEISKMLEIEINSSNPDGGYILLSAEVINGIDSQISASASSGFENVVSVTKENTVGNKTFFKVTGLSETIDSPAIIAFSSYANNLTQYVYVNVYSQVNGMTKNQSKNENNFLVNGKTYFLNGNGFESDVNSLTENQMITFSPSQNSRRELSWEIKKGEVYEKIDSSFTVGAGYINNGLVTLRATDVHEKGIGESTEFSLPVLDEIAEMIDLAWTYTDSIPTSDFDDKDKEGVLISNISNDDRYTGYAWVGYAGDELVITPVVSKKTIVGKKPEYIPLTQKEIENEIIIIGQDGGEGYTYYAIKTAKSDNTADYQIFFKVGYANYNYSGSTSNLYLDMREKVEEVLVTTNGYYQLSGNHSDEAEDSYKEYKEIDLYDNYSTIKGVSNKDYGQLFKIELSPDVLDGSGLYSIKLESPTDVEGGITSDGSCPIILKYRHTNGTIETIAMSESGSVWTSGEISAAGELYLQASSQLNNQTTKGFTITFTSKDNAKAQTSFGLVLHKSASADDLIALDGGDITIDSSLDSESLTQSITLKLNGQTNLDGLAISYEGSCIDFSPLTATDKNVEENWVEFTFTATLKTLAYGVTANESYKITHVNGGESKAFTINIVLPFKNVTIYPDMGDNLSNSITNAQYSENNDVTSLMLTNKSITPLIISMPVTNGYTPKLTEIKAQYLDLEEFVLMTIDEVLENAKLANESKFISFSSSIEELKGSINTKAVGYSYLLLTFTGKDAEGEDYSINKLILIESYNSPEGLMISPSSDGSVELYSVESVSDDYDYLTYKNIEIKFENTNTTYDKNQNVTIESKFYPDNFSKYYSIDNKVVSSTGLSFTITALSTNGYNLLKDVITVTYSIKKGEQTVLSIPTSIALTIKNAQRIESVEWINYDEEGLYYEVEPTGTVGATGTNASQFIILQTSPTNANNDKMRVVVTDDKGEESTFVYRNNNIISDSTIALQLGSNIGGGKSGYAYILPDDAIFSGQVNYYYYVDGEGEKIAFADANASQLTEKEDSFEIGDIALHYDDLIKYGFFKSNAGEETRQVSFENIIVKIKIEVANGSKEHPYRVYNQAQFVNMQSSLYHVIMNDIELTSSTWSPIENLTGGISGYSKDITITLSENNIAKTIESTGYIKNLTLIGNVSASGFVADVNKGTIDGVTIDTNGNRASSLIGEAIAGGLVEINEGTITNSAVLGLDIIADIIGGLAGENLGSISNSRVEFYNLVTGADEDGSKTYGVNKFAGTTVGGLVGRMTGGSITYTYAYDYTLTASHCENGLADPFVGEISGGSLSHVFSVVGLNSTKADGFISDYYYSYYVDEVYTSHTQILNNKVVEGKEGFDSEVNGGKEHFKDLYQAKALTGAELKDKQVETTDINGYYQSIAVNATQGILFFYDIENDDDLTTSEKQDLDKLNTIKVADLLKISASGNIVVTSSNAQIVKVTGSSIQILKTGEVTLTVSVKQDAFATKTIYLTVVNAISDLVISRIDESGKYIELENKQVNIQRTKSMDVTVNAKLTQVILGNLANRYDFVMGDYYLAPITEKVVTDETGDVVEAKAGENIVKLTTGTTSVQTTISLSPVLFKDEFLQEAIKKVFTKSFTANPTDGVITFVISNDQVSITPSTTAVVKAKITTTAKEDKVYPVIVMGQSSSAMEREWTGNEYIFKDDFGQEILTVTREINSQDESASPYIYEYNLTFAVHQNYQSRVADDITFAVFFKSSSGASSDSFTILLTKQEITNVDTTNIKITRTYIEKSIEHYEATNRTSVLSPGNASILKVNVNPEFAYYDYAEIYYSGTSILDAVDIEAVEGENINKGVYRALSSTTATVSTVGTRFRYIPSEESTNRHNLYFKLWINTTVDRNTQLQITVAFYKYGEYGQGELLDYVNHYIDVKYLSQPRVTISGEEVAYIAKGTTSEVKIEVLEDQVCDEVVLDGKEISGVYLTSLSDLGIDSDRGVRTYTAKLVCDVEAKTDAKNVFYIKASVSRELNGQMESKTTFATAVIVDFKINEISISGASEGTLTVWQNVSKQFDVDYFLSPDDSQYSINSNNQDIVDSLKLAKKTFENSHYYPANIDSAQSEYYINWLKVDGQWQAQSLLDRLYVKTSEGDKPYDDENLNLPFEFSQDGSVFKVKGTNANASDVTMVLYTYIYAGGVQSVIETEFVIHVETFSDPDLPLSIKTSEDFLKLDPSTKENAEIIPQDYILENDIVLENYTPFNTSAIRSLDGNGYTIFIKSFDVESTNTLNLALFTTVSTLTANENNSASETTLKNLRVNYYNGGQIIIDVSRHKEINIAGIAITNDGVITNCEVVSFYQPTLVGESVIDGTSACTSHSKTKGFNVAYRNGANTEDIFIADNSTWTSQIAGFVLNNNGSITNSRVGGDEIYLITQASQNDDTADAEVRDVDQFNIVGQGDIAGFVLNNNGAIASSFVKRADITNNSGATKYFTAGFVGKNAINSSILTSYIEGVETSGANAENGELYANQGSSIASETGYIAGFIYENNGVIKNSYSNILIANSTDMQKVYLASGFVYINGGTLENCYSASQVKNANYSQMNFSGLNKDGVLLKEGEYINCYYFSLGSYASEASESAENLENTTESQYNTGATLIKDPALSSSYYGFSIAENTTAVHKDGIWKMDGVYGIKLIEADYITYSHRYKNVFSTSDDSDYYLTTEVDGETIKYNLPYGSLNVSGLGENVNTTLGGNNNPILIADADDWQAVNGQSLSSYIQDFYVGGNVRGFYRIVKDIDLSVLNQDVASSSKNFTGALYGNGFTISGIALSQTGEETAIKDTTAFGLYASITATTYNSEGADTGIKKSPALVSNVNLDIAQVTAGNVPAVGGLAGTIQNATIVNVSVNFEDESIVEGMHYVGGLVGFAYGDNKIKNITISNPNIVADTYTEDDADNYIKTQDLINIRNAINAGVKKMLQDTSANYSYAGSAIGFIENYSSSTELKTIKYEHNNENTVYDVNNIRVDGNVKVKGQVVGGVFGFVGINTEVNDIALTINAGEEADSKLISTRYFAGGIAGQSFGKISRASASHEEAVQNEIEDNMASFYGGTTTVERGILDLFDTTKTDLENTQIAVGGLIGYAGTGYLEVSYSKLNVTAMSAEYAGGIIGYMDVSSAENFSVKEISTMYQAEDGTSAKYFINEVYATGDVRANTMAGGLIGAIKGENSNIKLLSVNALNYLTTYNYLTGEYQTLNAGQYEISSNFNINSFVGALIDSKDNLEKFEVRDASSSDVKEDESTGALQWKDSTSGNYKITLKKQEYKSEEESANLLSGYISFVQAVESYSSTGGSVDEPLASVARYNYYSFDGQQVYLSRFGEPMLISSTTVDGKTVYQYNKELESLVDFNEDLAATGEYMLNIYSITSPHLYTDSTVGHTMTQTGFINSGIWLSSNWEHPIDDLFPSIKLKEVYDIVYLDVYNANEVFNQMNKNPNLTVIVRGLKTADSDIDNPSSYDDIVICQDAELGEGYFTVAGSTQGESFTKIKDYAGKIIGGKYPIDAGEDKYIKIVSYAGNFIDSVKEGFAVSNQTFVYGKIATLADGEIEPKTDTSLDYIPITNGLFVDGSMMGVKLTGLKIVLKNVDNVQANSDTHSYGLVASSISSSTLNGVTIDARGIAESAVILAITSDGGERATLNAGLIAGRIAQESEEEVMLVKNVSVSTNENQTLISTSGGQKFTNAYIGGYFGYIPDEENGTAGFRITLSGFENPVNMNITHEGAEDLFVGGFAGYVTGVKNLLTAENSLLKYNIKYTLPSQVTDLRLGNVIGCLASGSDLTINGSSTGTDAGEITQTINGSIASPITVTKAYIGGAVGYHDKAPLTIKGFRTYDLSVEKDKVDTTEQVVYGGIVGLSKAKLTLTTTNSTEVTGDDDITLNATSGSIIAGSLLGKSTATAVQKSETSFDETSLEITGKYTSELNFNLTGLDITFGGLVGMLYNDETAVPTAEGKVNAQNVNISSSQITQYTGDVTYTGTGSATLGGIVGSIESSDSSYSKLDISSTSHGGSFTINDSQDASITVGGTIGNTEFGGNENNKITLQNNYNYGNTFVDYTTDFTSLSEYNNGGLIGMLNKADYSISGNYVASTSHNSRYASSSDTAHALFGNGEPTGAILNNFYSHAVCLLTDDFGRDIAYNTVYTTDRSGYNRGILSAEEAKNETTIVSKILEGIKATFDPGHKLNPIEFTADSDTSLGSADKGVFHNLTYYTLTSDIEITNKMFTLTNTAFIGDGFEIKFTSDTSDVTSLFENSSDAGYSFISSLVEIVDMKFDIASDADTRIAGLIKNNLTDDKNDLLVWHFNTQYYAINVLGTIDVGSSEELFVAGLAYKVEGKISDCSTDVDIVDRGAKSWIYEFAILDVYYDKVNEKDVDCGAIVENSFSLGSVTTYGGGYIRPFAGGVGTFYNNYSATRLDWNDYINLDNTTKEIYYTLGVVYDADALGVINSFTTTYSTIESTLNNSMWISEVWFNYGYPTLKYQYLKISSFALQGEAEYECDNAEHNHNDSSKNDYKPTYDCYVENYTYTRVKNGTQAKENETFYMVPNAGVLALAINNGYKNIALKYDIDLVKTVTYSVPHKQGSIDVPAGQFNYKLSAFDGKFDGQGHTISGLSTSLFDSVGSTNTTKETCYVRNLRLTEVTGSAPALATSIENTTISNITIGGTTSARGGLAESASNVEINTIQSTMIINKTYTSTTSQTRNVGGIIATAVDSQVLYCSNYGNITVNEEVNKQSSVVGGIVGDSEDSSIKYSSNAGSVINGYTTDTEVTHGSFVTGGIAGNADSTTIDHCYNTGVIKSGNKNLNATQPDDKYTRSWAGGILAHWYVKEDNKNTISYCYNEGTVEALGANGSFEIHEGDTGHVYGQTYSTDKNKWEYAIDEGTMTYEDFMANPTYKQGAEFTLENGKRGRYVWEAINNSITILQTSDKNVEVYGIGPGADASNYYQLETSVTGQLSVFANGSALNEGDVVMSIDKDNISVPEYDYDKTFDYIAHYYGSQFFGGGWKWSADMMLANGYEPNDILKQSLSLKYNTKTDSPPSLSSKEEYMNGASTNSLGLPTSFVLDQTYTLSMDLEIFKNNKLKKEFETWSTDLTESFVYGINSNAEGFTKGDVNILNQYCWLALQSSGQVTSSDSICNGIKAQTFEASGANINKTWEKFSTTPAEKIVESTKSQKGGEAEVVAIAGQNFYIANNNNLGIFATGTAFQDITVDLSSNTLEGIESLEYSFTFDSIKCEGYSISYTNEEWNDDSKTLSARVYYDKTLAGKDFTAAISVSYNQTGTIDTTNVKLYLTEIGNVGLGLESVDLTDKDLWEEFDFIKNGQSYTAYKLTNGNESIYLQYDEKLSDFVYIPSAELKEITINTNNDGETIYSEKTSTINTLNLSEIIGKTWTLTYFETSYEDLLFTNGGSEIVTVDRPDDETASLVTKVENINGILPTSGEVAWANTYVFDKDNNLIALSLNMPYWAVSSGYSHALEDCYVVDSKFNLASYTTLSLQYIGTGSQDGSVITAGTVDPKTGVITFNEGNTLDYAITYNLVDGNGTTVIGGLVGGHGILSHKYLKGADYYIYSNGASLETSDKTTTASIVVDDCGTYEVTLTLQGEISGYTHLFDENPGVTFVNENNTEYKYDDYNSLEVSAIVTYNTITSYEITKTTSSDRFDMIGVYNLTIGDTSLEKVYSATETSSKTLTNSTSVEYNFDLVLTMYETHTFEKDGQRDYDIYLSTDDSSSNVKYSYSYMTDEDENDLSISMMSFHIYDLVSKDELDSLGIEEGNTLNISVVYTGTNDGGETVSTSQDIEVYYTGNTTEYIEFFPANISSIEIEKIGSVDDETLSNINELNELSLVNQAEDYSYLYINSTNYKVRSYAFGYTDETSSDNEKTKIAQDPTFHDLTYMVENTSKIEKFDAINGTIALENYKYNVAYNAGVEGTELMGSASITIYAKSSKETTNEPYSISLQKEYTNRENKLSNNNETEALPIIFMEDISLGYIETPNIISFNIIGNGYNLSSYGMTVAYQLNAATIKDLNILSQVGMFNVADDNTSFFVHTPFNTGKALNINLYGSKSDIHSAITYSGKDEGGELITLDNKYQISALNSTGLTSYVTIDAGLINQDIILFANDSCTQKATCFASNGYDQYITSNITSSKITAIFDTTQNWTELITKGQFEGYHIYEYGEVDATTAQQGQSGAPRGFINVSPIEGWNENYVAPASNADKNDTTPAFDVCSNNITEYTRLKIWNSDEKRDETLEEYCTRNNIAYKEETNQDETNAIECRDGLKIRNSAISGIVNYWGFDADANKDSITESGYVTPHYKAYRNHDDEELIGWDGDEYKPKTFVLNLIRSVLGDYNYSSPGLDEETTEYDTGNHVYTR